MIQWREWSVVRLAENLIKWKSKLLIICITYLAYIVKEKYCRQDFSLNMFWDSVHAISHLKKCTLYLFVDWSLKPCSFNCTLVFQHNKMIISKNLKLPPSVHTALWWVIKVGVMWSCASSISTSGNLCWPRAPCHEAAGADGQENTAESPTFKDAVLWL